MAIYIKKGKSTIKGFCNACDKRNYSVVWEIWLSVSPDFANGLSFRLCNSCKAKLAKTLKERPKTKFIDRLKT